MEETTVSVKEVYDFIDGIAPFISQESWDNSGLLCGCMDNRVSGIMCALDLSMNVIDAAQNNGANTIFTHHPIMFNGRKNLREDDTEGKMLCRLVRGGFNVISAHTNFDKADGGVNDILARTLNLSNVTGVEGDEDGYMRIGDTEPMPLAQFSLKVKKLLGDAVRAYGDPDMQVRRVALCGGAGGEFAAIAKKAGADAYITGEMRYHDSLDLAQSGFATIHAGHDATERVAVSELHTRLKDRFEPVGIRVHRCETDSFSLNQI